MSTGSPEDREGRREPTDADVDREWAQITAGLSDLVDLSGTADPTGPNSPDDPAPGLAGEDDPSSHDAGESDSAGTRPLSATDAGERRVGDLPEGVPGAGGGGPRDYLMPEEDEDEGFIPPEPPPIGRTDPLPTLAWLMALGGPVLTVLLLILWTDAPGWLYLSAVVASVAGWLVLFWRMPKNRSDSGDDNGAVL